MRRFVALLALTLGMLAVLLPASASADVNDFSYSSWDARYDLSLDDEGRSVAHVTETLVAEFPEFDQNKGIVRGYPERYEGAGLSLEIVSVTDAEGRAVPFETESEDGMLLVLTGTDDYVHGSTTYVIEYTMRDFMITGAGSGNDEFYWDLLPVDSTQNIGRFRADIALSDELADGLTGDVACYQGRQGSTETCTLDGPRAEEGAHVFAVTSGERAAGDGVTVAIGFTAGTVTQPPARQPDAVADFGPAALAAGAVALAGGAWASFAVFVRRRRTATGIVVAQFDVPEDMPPLVAAPLIPGAPHPIPAQLVHLAVGGAIRLEDEQGSDRPAVRLIDRGAAVTPLDQATVDAVFTGDTTMRTIPRKSTKFAKRMAKLVSAGTKEAAARGWTTKERSRAAMVFGWAAIAVFAASVVMLIWAATRDRDLLPLGIVAVVMTFVVVPITSFAAFGKHTVLTRAGAEQHEYLLGVKEFIRVAETDRLRMLQSYQGAERRSDGAVDVVHLYEKLLPYAMLFGEEKSWGKVLDTAYSDAGDGPSWINVAVGVSLTSRLSNYSSSVTASATYTPASSSAGGSTGGGFSGGGGGGGFSGGR
ncbi:DUF2207 domain-containing protein [Microbacterium sp. H1-D42]|uniref:DUF2207 family protein n=1 Tax=Microbacterium sp. H1-D42 TaxID=2925844 RepID=UPI001F53478F|nr:DUF2207 domain-containing protein [Microbacterium sp. H1-D42]UNK70385.1 DUF2207 domain-containing protein [Microbacterium sp. H1-D42]